MQTPQGSMLPDTTPVTGILAPTLGTPQLEHSFVMIGAQIGSTAESGGVVNSSWYSNQYFAGTLSLVKYWRSGITSINYSGGGYASINNQQGNGSYQTFSFSQTAHAGRWDFSFVDVPQYLPESRFGFGGGTSLGNPGTGGPLPIPVPGINGGPGQDIYSAVGARFSNTAAAQVNYVLSQRDSVTFTGSYGLLRFMDSSNFDNDTFSGGMGYNRQVTKMDSLGLFYSFGAFHFSGSPQAYGSHSVGLSYGRKITGKLALQLSAGPQINTYRIPVGTSSSSVSAYATANLSYALQDASLNVTYRHGLSNGGGVLVGSQMDTVTAAAGRRLGRVWNGFASFGYSRNASVGDLPGSSNQTYNDWFLNVGASRPFGRNINFSAAYSVNFENAQQPGCSTGSCNTDFTQHIITLSLQWHTRPFVLH